MCKKRIKITPCVFLYIKRGDKILLSRRFNTGYKDGNYSLASGHIKKGEILEEALIREAKEELGITIKKEDIFLIYIMNRETTEGGRIDFVFTVSKWGGEINNNEPNKCDRLAWFNAEKLPKNIITYVKVMLDGILNNNIYQSQKEAPSSTI